ncbi:hypothetical protein EGT07_07870 [Herbaspirillum sp. HC18]|nr:hypothetical protein EGT07_07870 [Herbaspirillum sp. HC18]
MTDSIKITLNLSKLSPIVRKDIRAKICTVANPWGEVEEQYTKPSVQRSALSGTKTKWVVRCSTDALCPELGEVPTQIEADLNIPNAVVGHNVVHGTSVFAAGIAALELLRIWLAKQGLPKEELDRLAAEDVSLRGVTLTYLMKCGSSQEAKDLVDAINQTGKVLNPKRKFWDSSNVTVRLPARDYVLETYVKSELKHCKWAADAPIDALLHEMAHVVRIEAKVGLSFLRKRNLVSLVSWRGAYETGLYERLFHETVHKSLRLDGVRLRHKAPREEVYAELSPTEARLLRGYVEGRDPWKFQSIAESRNPGKRRSELRKSILKVAGVDIDIPWKEHVKLRCFELVNQLRYPGDYRPADSHVLWCFCEENWLSLREKMRHVYQQAIAKAPS